MRSWSGRRGLWRGGRCHPIGGLWWWVGGDWRTNCLVRLSALFGCYDVWTNSMEWNGKDKIDITALDGIGIG